MRDYDTSGLFAQRSRYIEIGQFVEAEGFDGMKKLVELSVQRRNPDESLTMYGLSSQCFLGERPKELLFFFTFFEPLFYAEGLFSDSPKEVFERHSYWVSKGGLHNPDIT